MAEKDSTETKEKGKTCRSCLFVDQDTKDRDNCLRFARFVDHALHDTSKDCDYWTPAVGRNEMRTVSGLKG